MKRASYAEFAVTPRMVFLADRCRPDLRDQRCRAVVEQCLAAYGERRIIYRDSGGEWGEQLHTGIQFRGFAPYTDRTPDEEAA
ncbi:hypothetical protein EOA75_01130 [Mesorhizobium sp. M1A.F.Ca.IN.022.07.1.1]|uniref:hypothetical protein n=1 Tax=Mesorhizobium sp. M1A.F.Ca.IN.022.07.1.1 TaxID=2496767 RepID=UPI000FCBDDB2|nr:hypothetical protein [Mesorhizobium sp. M1A.F.Ca.IN.022.07.1.1]RUV98169.1 hypothetical protein EOA75_01130 [Mesorhizobium sp. M1A.F.Ca.IN.022.07.1.1]